MRNIVECINNFFGGDCVDVMANMPDNSVDMIVTSPPYDGIRDYKGFKLNLSTVGIQSFRVLKEGGIAVSGSNEGFWENAYFF